MESGLLDVEIIDVSVDDEDGFPIDQVQWADAVLIVYSIIDRESFNYAVRSLGEIRQIQNGPATYLVANKADLDHLREVSNEKKYKKILVALICRDFLERFNLSRFTEKNVSQLKICVNDCLFSILLSWKFVLFYLRLKT